MEWLDVVLFGVIVVVGYGFARMGFRLSSRPAVKVVKRGKKAEGEGSEEKAVEDEAQDDFSSKFFRLASGVFFAGFGMVIIWMAMDRYLPQAQVPDGKPPGGHTESSDVMGEVVLKLTVIQSDAATDESEKQKSTTTPKIDVRVEEVSLGDESTRPPSRKWQWQATVDRNSLPRPTLFAGNGGVRN